MLLEYNGICQYCISAVNFLELCFALVDRSLRNVGGCFTLVHHVYARFSDRRQCTTRVVMAYLTVELVGLELHSMPELFWRNQTFKPSRMIPATSLLLLPFNAADILLVASIEVHD